MARRQRGKGADLIVGREYKFNALTGHDDEAGSHHRVDARGAARAFDGVVAQGDSGTDQPAKPRRCAMKLMPTTRVMAASLKRLSRKSRLGLPKLI